MAIVPMFHANAWGLPYARRAGGATGVMPGPRMTPSRPRRVDRATSSVTFAAGVPTIWHGHAAPRPTSRDLSRPDGDPVRRLGRARVADPRLRRAVRRPDPAGLGHDRDEPDRRRSRACRRRAERPDERYRLRATQGRVVPLRRSSPAIDEERLGRRPSARSVRGPWIAARLLRGRRAAARSSPTTAGCAPATSPSIDRRRLHRARRPHQGPREVRRRVDLVGRARERDHGPPEGPRGGGHRRTRRAAGASGRCACVVPREGERPRRRRGQDVPRPSASRSGGCPSGSSSSTRCPRLVGKFDKKVLRRRLAEEAASDRLVAAPKASALRHDAGAIERLVSDLVAIDSVNPDLVPGGAGEARDRGVRGGVAARRRGSRSRSTSRARARAERRRARARRGGGRRCCCAPTSTRSASRG